MNWIDLLILFLAVLAAISGARQGVIIALPAFLGVLGGAILGIQLAPLVVKQFTNTASRVAFAVGIFVLLVALGETLGVWIGRSLRQRLQSPRLASVDSVFGAVVQGAVVFLVAWLIALPLTTVGNLPELTSEVKESTILGGVDDLMPPSAQQLPNDLRELLDVSGFPAAVDPFSRTPISQVDPPDAALQASPVVQKVRPSVLKIHARAQSCSRALEGTGFVISPQRLMTNAHVVAGSDQVTVETDNGDLTARVVYYDPDTDLAILSVPRLTAPPLEFAARDGSAGQDGIVVGYPLDGPYTASPARIRQRISLQGPDIYEAKKVSRDVFTVRATVRSGNSGGPLVDTNGLVIGVVFGAAVDDPETGFVLTATEVFDEVAQAPGLAKQVSTSNCVT